MRLLLGLFLFAASLVNSLGSALNWRHEVIYQIFERSFFDSNGDRNGDFRGIATQIPYIKHLGATAILLQPIFKSRFYHNYFADSFFQADQTLGGNRQFFAMVRKAHRNHLKVILDMEPQYVANRHRWFSDASKYPGRILPRLGVMGFSELPTYTGLKIPCTTVNLKNPEVVKEITRSFLFWAAPDGIAADGVDGFRIDHMMDDLDNHHIDTNLLSGFWAPLEARVRKAKHKVFFVGEQADWASLGQDQFRSGKVDSVYAISLRFTFMDAVKHGLAESALGRAVAAEAGATPRTKTQLLVIEDHDLARYATLVRSDPALLRLGAAFQFCLRGTPSVYYGQELGMKGEQLHGHDDGNDIPDRLAFRWKSRLNAKGTANWYGPGPWTKPGYSLDHDGISVQEEARDGGSLLNFYRRLIWFRRTHRALTDGSEEVVPTANPALLAVRRTFRHQGVLALFNFGDVRVKLGRVPGNSVDLLSGEAISALTLSAHGFRYIGFRKR